MPRSDDAVATGVGRDGAADAVVGVVGSAGAGVRVLGAPGVSEAKAVGDV